eukprot:gnl/TRDRNA2_/TRDRNA2_156554_c0_seq1.p1 gnl/TRDRNA2_/TRDRNA2_156554_c0~~gnl/TRDRNA2_/TRDRNA2_156554_c0_seq1.p1  ORF type:complete len:386 (-),score=41.24 gnl/TRDRNA2_/TRDRNA2_156554_c0_seq1:284-1441(-)
MWKLLSVLHVGLIAASVRIASGYVRLRHSSLSQQDYFSLREPYKQQLGKQNDTIHQLHAVVVKRQQNSHLHRNVSGGGYILPGSIDYGDLTCMRWTGGTCGWSDCKAERGPTSCENTKCICLPGYCSDSSGKCTPLKGEWVGDYSISFVKPYVSSKPYVGAEKNEGGLFGPGILKYPLASTADPSRMWRIASDSKGYVRLANLHFQSKVFTIYHNRRRRSDFFLQRDKEGKESAMSEAMPRHAVALAGISDDDDLWPMLMPLEDITPLSATFQIRETRGGLEIWDPQQGVSLAGANPDWWIKDDVASRGISECYPESWAVGACEDRQLVRFEPAISGEVISMGPQNKIRQITTLTKFQSFLVVIAVVLVFAGCCAFQMMASRQAF